MSESEFQRLLDAARDALVPRLRESPELRRFADALADWLKAEVRLAERPDEPTIPSTDAPSEQPGPTEPAPPDNDAKAPALAPSTSKRAIVPLKIGDQLIHVSVQGETEDIGRARRAVSIPDDDDAPSRPDRSFPTDIDLALIAERSRLKAESCRLFIARRAARPGSDEERDLVARMNDMIAKAKSTRECFLWVFWRERAQPNDDALREIAQCYDAHADASDLIRLLDENPKIASREDLEEAFFLLAHASAALRCALEATWLSAPDVDQDESHLWLRRETANRQIYIPRYMSIDDRPDPSDAPLIRDEARALRDALLARKRSAAQIDERFKRIAYHSSRAERDPSDHAKHDLERIAETIAQLLDLGVRADDPRFARSIAAPVRERVRATTDRPNVAQALDAITRSTSIPDEPLEIETPARAWSENVLRARALLRGKRIVVLGGIRKPDAEERIIDAFDLAALDWVRLNEHTSGAPMNAPIARADTALVVILIRFIGHLHAEEARLAATASGKPFIHLPAGYSPEQIADAVLQQASRALVRQGDPDQ